MTKHSLALWRFHVKIEDDDEEMFRQVRVKPWFTTFCRETTLQGFPNLTIQPGIFKKIFWIIAILLCAIGLGWELMTFFDKFLSWTASTSVTVQTARQLPFPAITICNNNPVTTDWYMDHGVGKTQTQTGPGAGPSAGPSVGPGVGTGAPVASGPLPTGSIPAVTVPVATALPVSGPTVAVGTTVASLPVTITAAAITLPPLPGRRKRQIATLPPSGVNLGSSPSPSLANTAAGASAAGTLNNNNNNNRQPQRQDFTEAMQTTLNIQAAASQVDYQNRSLVGHQLCDTVVSMEYEGVNQSPGTNFSTWHWNSIYGNCFSFNMGYLKRYSSSASSKNTWTIKSGADGSGVRISSQPGDQYGLSLLLNADIAHYLTITKQVGWRIVIHNQTEMPFPEESGIFVMPGTSTRIGISMKYLKRLGVVPNWLYNAPYSNCIDDTNYVQDDPRNAYTNLLEVSYTKSACLKTCYQKEVMETCNCFDFNYPNNGSAFPQNSHTLKPCTYSNTTLWQCKLNVQQLYLDSNLDCDCPDTCESYAFETTISALKWPNAQSPTLQNICSDIYQTLIKRVNGTDSTCTNFTYSVKSAKAEPDGIPRFTKKLQQCISQQFDSSLASNDEMAQFLVGSQFAEVFIFYKDFNYQAIEEDQLFELADLLAYLGGILGLFFGFTFITLFEYIQFLIDLLLLAVGKVAKCGSKNNKITTDGPLHPLSAGDQYYPDQRRLAQAMKTDGMMSPTNSHGRQNNGNAIHLNMPQLVMGPDYGSGHYNQGPYPPSY